MRARAAPVVAMLSAAVAAGGEDSVPLRLARGRLPIVSVHVNGDGPHDFLLDTGSTSTVLRSDLARSLELGAVSEASVGTPAGERSFVRVERSVVTVGGVAPRPLHALVADLDALDGLDRRLRGILGLDWLSSFNVLIDYERRRLTLHAIDEDGPPAERVPFRVAGKRILVPVGARVRVESAVWLILDTGAEGVVLFEPSALPVERNPARVVKLSSAGGRAILRTGRLESLLVGTVRLRDVPVTLIPHPSALAGSEGLLPGRLFRRLYLNHREGYVVFDPSL